MKTRLTLTLAALAATTLAASAPAATILLNDTWTDGQRTQTNLPNESAVFVSAAASTSVAAGSLSYTQSTGSQRLITYFAGAGSPVSVPVGQALKATVSFFARDGLGTSVSRNFRVGLYRDPDGTQVAVDGFNDAGGSGNPWGNAEGYAGLFPLSTTAGTTQLFQIQKRTLVDGSQTSLMGAGAAYTAGPAGGGIVTAALNNLYTLTFTLNRVAAAQMNVTATLADSSGTLANLTTINTTDGTSQLGTGAPYTAFDMLSFRFSAADGTANRLEFTRIKVELIPEPASLGLLGLAGAALAVFRRRR
jgi:hypothetical protein